MLKLLKIYYIIIKYYGGFSVLSGIITNNFLFVPKSLECRINDFGVFGDAFLGTTDFITLKSFNNRCFTNLQINL
jgi:hypothetical protein